MRTFFIGWNDLDSNAHVANTAYMAMMNETRMTYFRQKGLNERYFSKNQIGPAVLNEEFYYYKELLPGEEVSAQLWLKGMSPDGRFGRIAHPLYRKDELVAYSELTFCWMDLARRRILHPLPEIVQKAMRDVPKAEDYRLMTKAELKLGKRS